MYSDARKIHLLEAVLKVKDEAILEKLEEVLNQTNSLVPQRQSSSIYDFLGIITAEEAAEMRQAVHDTSEQINPDDWR